MNGYRVVPAPAKVVDRMIRCWRCDVDMRKPSESHLVDNAPCRDCRDALADLGTPLSSWRLPRKSQSKVAA